jgi:hypothetical protein
MAPSAAEVAKFNEALSGHFKTHLSQVKDTGKLSDKEFKAQKEKADGLTDQLTSITKLITPGANVTKEDRQKILKNALVGLTKTLFKDSEGAEDLIGLIDELFTKAGEGFKVGSDDLQTVVDKVKQLCLLKVDEKKKPKVEAIVDTIVSVTMLATGQSPGKEGIKAIEKNVTAVAKEVGGKDVATLTKQLILLIHLAAGDLTEAQKQQIFEEAMIGLLERTLFNGLLDAPFLQAFLKGYEFAAPFGQMMANDLKSYTQTQVAGQAVVALEGASPSWVTDAGSGKTTTVKIESGSFIGWTVTAFWDHTVDDIRLQVVSPSGTVWLLDKDGHNVTGEGQPKAATPPPPAPPKGEAGRKVLPVIAYATTHGDAPALKAKLDQAATAKQAALERWGPAKNALVEAEDAARTARAAYDDLRRHTTAADVLDKQRGVVEAANTNIAALSGPAARAWFDFNQRHHAWWAAKQAYDAEVKRNIQAGAALEGWAKADYEYLWTWYPNWSVPMPSSGGIAPAPKGIRPMIRTNIVYVAIVVALLAAVGLGWILLGGDDDPEPIDATPAAQADEPSDDPPTDDPPPEEPTPDDSDPNPPDGPAPLVSGDYAGTVDVDEDPAGHSCCVSPATTWPVLQVRETTTGEITITLEDVVEGIDLTSPLGATGEQFRAVGVGTVAGFQGTEVAFEGTVTPEAGLHGTLTVGGNRTLPTGQPISFRVDMAKAP